MQIDGSSTALNIFSTADYGFAVTSQTTHASFFVGGGLAGYGIGITGGTGPTAYGLSIDSVQVINEIDVLGDISAVNAANNIKGVADGMLIRNIAGGSDGGRTIGQALAASRNKVSFDVPGVGQFTVYDTNDSTPLWIGTYTRGANTLGPLTAVDPT
jgi:hypothetical protein